MSETVERSVSLQVPMGPRIARSGTVAIEAYDKVKVTLDAGAGDVEVNIQPADGAGQVKLLAITASEYDARLTFRSPESGTPTALEAPLVLIGAGAVGLLAAGPRKLWFDNGTAEAVTIEVLAGRDATS